MLQFASIPILCSILKMVLYFLKNTFIFFVVIVKHFISSQIPNSSIYYFINPCPSANSASMSAIFCFTSSMSMSSSSSKVST